MEDLWRSPINSRLGLSRSIQIQALSCFSKGVMSTTRPSVVEGGPLTVSFLMDDGSTLNVLASIDNTAATELDIDLLEVTGRACSGLYPFEQNPWTVHQ